MKILIIDDNIRYRLTLNRILLNRFPDVQCTFGNTGYDALRLYSETNPDVIIIDFLMPEMDGITAARAIRADYPLAKIVILSQLKSEEFAQEAISAGADAAFSKANIDDLLAFLDNLSTP